MTSIGNDIVALSNTDKQRTNDVRFHSKFITTAELSLYKDSLASQISFEDFVWLLWSVKESAYKYQKRFDTELIFSPTRIEINRIKSPDGQSVFTDLEEINVSGDNFYNGSVIIADKTLYFKAIINTDIIATIVNSDASFKNIHWGVQQIASPDSETQSISVRQLLLSRLKTTFPQGEFSLQKSLAGYPILLINESDSGIPISLAHHGLFTSYCFKIDRLEY